MLILLREMVDMNKGVAVLHDNLVRIDDGPEETWYVQVETNSLGRNYFKRVFKWQQAS